MSVVVKMAVILTVCVAAPLTSPWWLTLLVWWMALWATPSLDS